MTSSFPLHSLSLLILLLAGACSGTQEKQAVSGLSIVTTTGMLGDAVRSIVMDKATVQSLMGPGVDPHLYKASQSDLAKLDQADIIIYNGLYLEGKMEDILEKVGRTKRTLAVGDKLNPSRIIRFSETSSSVSYDPHIWFDVSLWMDAVAIISASLQEADTVNAAFFAGNTANYLRELGQLHDWVKTEIDSIPTAHRVLITSHDAFGYFGKAYGIEVHGLQGISTLSDYGLQDVSQMVNLIVQREVKAVFIESSVAPRSLEAVAEGCRKMGHEIRIGGTLFSDAMGANGTPEGTYIGMVKANVNTIAGALK